MFGYKDLKPNRMPKGNKADCPVLGCGTLVPPQSRHFQASDTFLCRTHQVFIGPSTFEYENYLDNLLWKDAEDVALLDAILESKRESRMAREKSEDALTWNVFRYLERQDQLPGYLHSSLGVSTASTKVIYWSHCQHSRGTWLPLAKARSVFGEALGEGSEPDLIIECDTDLIFIEAKLTSPNATTPREPRNRKQYLTGGQAWYKKVFAPTFTFEEVAVNQKLYELMRLWLIGTRIATEAHKRFHLVNLVRDGKELNIEARFRPHIIESAYRKFSRVTWESICAYVASADALQRLAKEQFIQYFSEKTLGYTSSGHLLKAFIV